MEKTLKLRKPSLKNLLDLLVVAEEMLFSFPVPSDLRFKYERMRSETFIKLRIRNHSLPLTAQALNDSPTKDPSNKVFLLEVFNCLHQTLLTLENFEEELAFKSVTMKNFYNILNAYGDKMLLKPERVNRNEEIEKLNELDLEVQLEKCKEKVHAKMEVLRKIKIEGEKVEKRVFDSIEIVKKGNEIEKNQKEMMELQKENRDLQERYKELLRDLEKSKEERESMKILHENQLSLVKQEMKKYKHKTEEQIEKPERNLVELITLKQKAADLELTVSKLHSSNSYLQELNTQLSSTSESFKLKVQKQKQKLQQLKSSLKETEKTLEYERNSFESNLKTLQHELFTQQSSLKAIQTENLQHIDNIHSQERLNLIRKHEEDLKDFKEEVAYYKKQLETNEDNSKKIIKSLQMEVLRTKEVILKQYEELSNEQQMKESQEIIEKLENKLIEVQSCLKYLAELFIPIYEIYADKQQDWDESEVGKVVGNFEEEYGKILISAEFLVFFLEKNLKDKNWLLNKLEVMHSETRLTKTNSVGTLASPGNFRDKGLFRQIWQDVKDTSIILQNFEKCRENLISQFVSK